MKHALLALIPAFTVSCVTLGRYEEMEGRVTAMERAATANDEREAQRFDNVTKLLKSAVDKLDKTSAALNSKLDGAGDEDRSIRGELEELRFRVDKLAKDFEVMKKAAEDRWGLNFLAAAPSVALPADAEGLFAHAQKALDAGQFPNARMAFAEFIKRHPTDERLPKVRYGLGRALYGENQMKAAVREFGEAFKAWQAIPASKAPPEAPESLWYAGLALESIDCKKSKEMLKFLKQSYPKSPRAAEVKARLAEKCK